MYSVFDNMNQAGRGGGLFSVTTPFSRPAFDGTVQPLNQNSSTYATDGLARLTRERFLDFQRRFRGFEDQQIAFATDRDAPMRAATEASADVSAAFSRIPGQQQRRNERMGITTDPADMASQQRATSLAAGLASVTAANRAARQTYDRQTAVFSGAGNSLPRIPT